MKRYLLFGVVVCWVAAPLLEAQNPEIRFLHIGNEDGLSHSLVQSIAEDSLGFLWFGTQDGLNRYDGYGFKTYYKGPTHRTPSDSWIRDLYVDRSNQLWITYTGLGLERFDPRSEMFYYYLPDSLSEHAISSHLLDHSQATVPKMFFEDSDGQLWIGTLQGLNRYHRNEDHFTRYLHDPRNPESLSDDRIVSIFEDPAGYLWVGTVHGLNRMDRSTGRVRRYMAEQGSTSHLNDDYITTAGYIDVDGSVWVGTRFGGLNIISDPDAEEPGVLHLLNKPLNPNQIPTIYNIVRSPSGIMLVASIEGLYRITKEGDRYKEELIGETTGIPIFHMLVDSKGFTWASSNENVETSLFRISPDTRNVEVFDARPKDPTMFCGGKVQALHESRTGLVWIGMEKNGILRVDLNARQFRTIDNYPGRGLYITNSEVYSIFEDDNRLLYVGTKTELNRIDLRTGTLKEYNNRMNLKRNLTWEYSTELPATLIGVLEQAPDGKIWMGAFDYKVSLYDPVTERFLNFHHNERDSTGFRPWSLRSICVTHDGNVYFGGTDYGLCKLEEDGLSFTYFPVVATGNPAGTNDTHIQYLCEDSEGILWIGTLRGGLNRLDPGSGRFSHLVHDSNDPVSLSNNRVKCILEPTIHGEEVLWVGTNNGGLNRFDKRTGEFTAITMDQGLPSNTIHGILEDKVGNLWLSTNRGLVQFDPVTERISIYTVEDGLVGNEFNEGAFFKNGDGVMYFGGTNGVNYFDPAEIKEKPEYDAPVVFTGFSISGNPVLPNDTINGRVVLEHSIPYTDQITLTHREHVVSFEFASLDIAAAGKLRYRYLLDGLEERWNEVDANQRFISYANIPSGSYTLKVAGTSSDGTSFRDPSEIMINVLPPFWQTPLFRLFVAVSILMIFLVILQVRTRILENQKKTLAREVEERTHDLKEANQLLEQKSSEIQHMAEKLHESDQMKLKFFTNISHEFRTPLTLLLGPTEKLLGRKDFSDVPAVRKELELMYRNERRLFRLINQLLEVRRVETGHLKLSVTEDDLVMYLREIYQLFMPYAEKKEIDFGFTSETDSLKLLFDADKIEKIFYNLLSNAFKYAPIRGTILLQMEKTGSDREEMVKISVQDDGPGIQPEHLPHVFDRFYQISGKHRAARISSGIGLSLSRDLVEKHYGRIEVHSEPGAGTCFEVYLPVSPETYKPEEIVTETGTDLTLEYTPSMLETYEYSREEHPCDTPLVGGELFRILLVEDNLDLQKFLYNEMSDAYQVILAQDGEEGLKILKDNLPDLIISDIMMPGMDGLTFCRRIKEDELTSHIPVVLLTAKSGEESQLSGFESGADDYITKPFNPEVLRLKIRNILEGRKHLAEKFSKAVNYIPENIKITQIDQGFLEKFIKFVEENIDDTELSGDMLASELGMSKGNLYKKLKTLTGMTVNIFVRTIRLKVAARLLKQGNYNISEIAYAVGFNNPKYFSTCFSEMFSVSPKEYMR